MSDKLRKIKDKASKLFGDGKLKDALKLYQQVVEEDPTELACKIKIGDIYRRLGQKGQAVLAYQVVAKHYAEDGMLLKAIAVGKLILSVDATHTSTQEMLADLYSKRAAPARAPGKGASPGPAPAAAQGAGKSDADLAADDDDVMIIERDATSLVDSKAEVRTKSGRLESSPPPQPARGAAWPVSASSAGAETKPVDLVVGAKVEPPRVIVGRKVEPPPPIAAPVAPSAAAPVAPGAFAWPVATSRPPAAAEPIEVSLLDSDVEEPGAVADEPIDLGATPVDAFPVPASLASEEADVEELIPLEDLEEAPSPPPVAAAPEAPPVSASAPPMPEAAATAAPSAINETHDVRVDHLPQIPLFSDLPKNAFIELLVQMTMREMKPGEYVIKEGEIGNSFFVIAQGKVRVVRKSPEGPDTVLAHLSDGAFFGEMALLQDGARIASVIVEQESQIFELSKPVLDSVVAQFPGVERVLRDFYTQRLLSTTMATHSLFRPFVAKERRHLMEMFKSRGFKAGEVLVKEGQKGEGLYLLLTGTLEVSKLKDKEPIVIAELTAGDMFGEMSLLTNRPTVATVTAVTDCFVLRLSKKAFDELIMTHPQVLELVSQISEERETENNAIFGAWTPKAEGGAALV